MSRFGTLAGTATHLKSHEKYAESTLFVLTTKSTRIARVSPAQDPYPAIDAEFLDSIFRYEQPAYCFQDEHERLGGQNEDSDLTGDAPLLSGACSLVSALAAFASSG